MQRLTFLLLLVLPICAYGDWSSCESELNRLSREARGAESVASDMQSLEREYENNKSQYERCRMFPDTFDLMGDECQFQRIQYNQSVDEYNSRLSDMQSELDSLIRRAKRAINECT